MVTGWRQSTLFVLLWATLGNGFPWGLAEACELEISYSLKADIERDPLGRPVVLDLTPGTEIEGTVSLRIDCPDGNSLAQNYAIDRFFRLGNYEYFLCEGGFIFYRLQNDTLWPHVSMSFLERDKTLEEWLELASKKKDPASTYAASQIIFTKKIGILLRRFEQMEPVPQEAWLPRVHRFVHPDVLVAVEGIAESNAYPSHADQLAEVIHWQGVLMEEPHSPDRQPEASAQSPPNPPKLLLERVAPQYPSELYRQGVQGTVWVELSIDTAGFVSEAVLLSSDFPDLVPYAMEAVHQWIFAPQILEGEPIPYKVRVPIDFGIRSSDP